MTSSHCSLRAFAHFMVDEPISDCHRADTHKPVPAAHVKSFEQQINELLKILTAPHARPAPAG
jgi:hypothetical protein